MWSTIYYTLKGLAKAKDLLEDSYNPNSISTDGNKGCRICGIPVNNNDKFCKCCGSGEIVTREDYFQDPPTEEEYNKAIERNKAVNKRIRPKNKSALYNDTNEEKKVRDRMENAFYCPSCNSEFPCNRGKLLSRSGLFKLLPERSFCSNCGEQIREYTQQEIDQALREI